MATANGYGYKLRFEEPVLELEAQIATLEKRPDAPDYADELAKLRESRDSMLAKLYEDLSPWDTVRVARHPQRPQTSDYIQLMCRDFREPEDRPEIRLSPASPESGPTKR